MNPWTARERHARTASDKSWLRCLVAEIGRQNETTGTLEEGKDSEK